ncbi:hypothetical protein D4S03_05075 [bacterium]|nr:MAG: hypothetical protein D4S03_05075 [bacterium]
MVISYQMKRWLTIILSSLALILFIYPSAFIYSKDTLPDRNDTRLIAYIIGQVQENVIHHQPLHYGTFFAPDKNTLAYSDLFLTSALITLPFRLFTNHPIIIFNLAFIINSLLTILTAYLLFSYLFKNHWIATITTFLLFLSGFHLHYYPHLQMFSLWPLLLCVYFFLRFQKENRLLFLTLFFLALTAQLAESIFGAYLIFFATAILFFSQPTRTILVGQIKIIIRYLLFFFPIWIALIFPYIQLHFSLPEASRSIREAANFSLGLEQPFTLYHGWTVIILFILTVLLSFPRKRESIQIGTYLNRFRVKPGMTLSWICLFYFSLIMSFGPVVKLLGKTVKIFGLPIPLPYAIFYYLFPGFTGFRTPSRFIILALLAATIIIGFALIPIFKKLKTKTKIIITAIILSLLFLEADFPLKGYPVNINLHPVYQEVKALPANAIILELPIKHWDMPDHEIELIRALYSLYHRHRRVGGISGFAKNSWVNLVEKINANGLDQESLLRLHSLGVTHVIENNKLFPLP